MEAINFENLNELTVQAFIDNAWKDIAKIIFPKNTDYTFDATEVHYESDYATQNLFADDHHAVSINHPVQLFFDDGGQQGWLKFIDDIIPSGSSRKYWLTQIDTEGMSANQQKFVLLAYGAISPIGNLRIKESIEAVTKVPTQYFEVSEVANRGADFLSYAQTRGAAAGGATGAGGEAPKLLLRRSKNDAVWIDTYQENTNINDMYYLVKFPRGNRSGIDDAVLVAEYHYYHELTDMGFSTIPVADMKLEEGDNHHSLWLPRFDITTQADGTTKRYAMESVYSMLKKPPGTILDHGETIRELIALITESNTVKEKDLLFDVEAFIIEWVRRDLLNIAFGNSDNHGRNTSFYRDEKGIRLTPIYDFAPMKADPEGIPRTTKWAAPDLELGGDFNFINIAHSLSDLIDPEVLMNELKVTARQLVGLKQRLIDRGVPEQIINMPIFGFDFLDQKLQRWELL
ncbi:type II toxin-antitoxin system HipA family toxin [Psychromonas algicola]|uniref:type II toxin-antitoxin system HipA family toxin n=1 Tax=Psychromonas algicola TaxID=2555642 RepID=UPI0010675D31|nr:HipA domain-containing protein [Psychromonas sp. RZ5]TEW52179.1 type II toxin-antitoxin system HipA family toxin [Psychromonas sp. RZ5]